MLNKIRLSVVLATKNEEANVGKCLETVRGIADEIIIFDEFSDDRTVDIVRKFGAKVYKHRHKNNFHETKQKAIEKAKGRWILQLDADERLTEKLAKEIKEVVELNNDQIISEQFEKKCKQNPEAYKLFLKHQKLIEKRYSSQVKGGKGLGIGTEELVAFFLPRKNYFLGKPLIHAGVYPDGVIRLFKKGAAKLPAMSVHEQMEIDGEVGWLFNDLEHHDSPTLERYLERMNRYTDLHAQELKEKDVSVNYWNLFKYSFLLPTYYFFLLFIRHKGFLDGMRGFIWSTFSALRFPIAYFKFWQISRMDKSLPRNSVR